MFHCPVKSNTRTNHTFKYILHQFKTQVRKYANECQLSSSKLRGYIEHKEERKCVQTGGGESQRARQTGRERERESQAYRDIQKGTQTQRKIRVRERADRQIQRETDIYPNGQTGMQAELATDKLRQRKKEIQRRREREKINE